MAKVRRLLRILFIDNYDSFTFNVIELLRQFDGLEITLKKNDELESVEIDNFDGVIISPGPNLPSAAGDLMPFLKRHILAIPMLGICLGHQAIAQHFGGSLGQYDIPLHGEKTLLTVKQNGVLFKKLPTQFEVGLYHSWYVQQTDLPKIFDVTAVNQDGIIMAMQHETLPVFSVQFHPESYMSEHGLAILQNFIKCL